MTYQELVIRLRDPKHISKTLCEECYQFMQPTLATLRCRKISTKKQDERVILIFNGTFRNLWSIEHQHPIGYWERLKRLGSEKEFEEFAFLKARKEELKKEWKRLYATTKSPKNQSGSADTGKDS